MREKRKSYFRVNVKNKAPRDTKNENLPLSIHIEITLCEVIFGYFNRENPGHYKLLNLMIILGKN
jgi:hypothetical protein